ncbi:MAG TPA: CFI-box-CTERM domain-containing protein [Burkholderiaceae bacterium]|jgi:hypothetical protein|nr:CFI-box-CTERM domain-containing protein [Burkholderiaceae bacterium]
MPTYTCSMKAVANGDGQEFDVTVEIAGKKNGTAKLLKANDETFWRMDKYDSVSFGGKGKGATYALTCYMLQTIQIKGGTHAIIPSCHGGMIGVGRTGFTEMAGSRQVTKSGSVEQISVETSDIPGTILALQLKMSANYNLTQGAAKKSGGCCYITTAVCDSLQLPDDCIELTMLRRFRDEVLLLTSQGIDDVQHYYAVAPEIVAAIDSRADASRIYTDLNLRYIQPSVAALARGEHHLPHALFREMIAETSARYLNESILESTTC